MNKIIYLDAAASSLKPHTVIDAEADFLRNGYANAGRGVCARATAVDDMVMNARRRVAEFIGAAPNQVIFTSGATDGLNRIVAILREIQNPVVAVSDLDHHSARLPWMELAAQGGAKIVNMALDENSDLGIQQIPRADIMVITAMSNVIGRPQDVAAIVRAARDKNPNVITIVDAAQYAAHCIIDVKKWDCDFMCFSGHKIGADTGIGVMYIKNPDIFPADKFGGGMVANVSGNDVVLNAAPEKFEAGTLPLTQIAGMVPALDYWAHYRADTDIIKYMYDQLKKMPRVKLLTDRDAALISFTVDGMHVLDFGALVGARGLCIRVGNMCASWIHARLGVPGSARISVGPYNTMGDAQSAISIIKTVVK